MKDKVVYPFGYGLSYTRFELKIISAEEAEGEIRFGIRVGNTGNYPGKEVVQIYYEAPAGKLGKPARALAAFAKTGLLQPGEYQELALSFPGVAMASFDDLGRIVRSAYVLEQGKYRFYIGKNVRDAVWVPFTYTVDADRVTRQLSSKAAPVQLKERLRSDGTLEPLPAGLPHDPMENGLGWD